MEETGWEREEREGEERGLGGEREGGEIEKRRWEKNVGCRRRKRELERKDNIIPNSEKEKERRRRRDT